MVLKHSSWTETGLTWNNAPGLDRTNLIGTGTLITTQTVTLTPGSTITFDISSYVASHLGQVITLQIISESVSSGIIVLNSREVQVSKPSLALNFSNLSIGSSMGGTTTYTYDAAGRRTTLTSPSFSIGYTYDNADQLLTATKSGLVTTYSYDANGSRTVLQSSNRTRTTYTWDVANRLQSVLLPSGNITTSTYRYDDLRFASSSPSGVQTFVWAQNNVLAAQGTTNNNVAWTELFTHSDRLLRAVGNTSTNQTLNRQYHLDAIGTVEAITNSTQATEADYITDAWGNVLSGSAQDNPHVYLGGLGYWQEPNVELNYVRARWLDPQTGTWLSVDPIPTEPRYRYVSNMPTFHVDPSGKQMGMLPVVRDDKGNVIEIRVDKGMQSIIKSGWDTVSDASLKTFNSASATYYQRLGKGDNAHIAAIQFVSNLWSGFTGSLFSGIDNGWRFLCEGNPEEAKRVQKELIRKRITHQSNWHYLFLDKDEELDRTGIAPWFAGVVSGFATTIGKAIADVPSFFFDIIYHLLRFPHILDEIKASGKQLWESIVSTFDQLPNALPYDRGHVLGTILANVFLLAKALQALLKIKNLPAAIKKDAVATAHKYVPKVDKIVIGINNPLVTKRWTTLKLAGVLADTDLVNADAYLNTLIQEAYVNAIKKSKTINEVRVFRVQGGTPPKASLERIIIGRLGELKVLPNVFNSKMTKLYVYFDDIERARVFIKNNGREGAYIISFEIDPRFATEVRKFAVRQADARMHPDRPEIADPRQTSPEARIRMNLHPTESSAYGLPENWIKRLEHAARRGTGRIEFEK